MKKLIIILISVFMLTILTACDEIGQQVKEDTAELLIEKLLGDNAKVVITYESPSPQNTLDITPTTTSDDTSGIIKSTQNEKTDNIIWQEDIPSQVPKISLKIESKLNTPNGVILNFGKTDKTVVNQYIKKLKELFFETINERINDKSIDVTYRIDDIIVKIYWYQDGSYIIMIIWK